MTSLQTKLSRVFQLMMEILLLSSKVKTRSMQVLQVVCASVG